MNKKEIRDKLKKCFKNCATGRTILRECVVEIMEAGLTKQDILDVADEMATGKMKDEAYLCAVTAIGQALRFDEKHKRTTTISINKDIKNIIKNKLKECFKRCGRARQQLRKCVKDAMNAGISKEEILAITDDMVGGLGKDEVSVCAIVAVEQVLMHNETEKLKKVVKMYAPYMQFSEK